MKLILSAKFLQKTNGRASFICSGLSVIMRAVISESNSDAHVSLYAKGMVGKEMRPPVFLSAHHQPLRHVPHILQSSVFVALLPLSKHIIL